MTLTEMMQLVAQNLATNGQYDISGAEVREVFENFLESFLHLDDNQDDRYYTENELDALLAGYEPVIDQNTAFNKNFGSGAGTVCEGNDSRLSNARQCDNTFAAAATARSNLSLGSLALKDDWDGDAAAYTALASKDSNTLYMIIGRDVPELYGPNDYQFFGPNDEAFIGGDE